MNTIGALASCASILIGCNGMAGSAIVERVPPGSPYDFVVHVRNVPDYRYNPQVSTDRNKMALRLVKRYCKRPRIVGQRILDTEIYGITSSKPDYIVLVRCS